MKRLFLDLRFSHEMEERFREEQYKNSIFIYRALAVLGAALYGLFFISDLRDFPDAARAAFVIRFLVVIPILLILAALTYSRISRRWVKPLACFGLCSAHGGAMALLAIINTPQAQLVYFGSTMLLISVSNAIIWQGYAWTAAASGLMIISYGAVMSAAVTPFVPLVKHMELLCAMAAFGAAASFFVELHWRNEFKIDYELRRQKRRAENATRLKDKFVTLVSHDLRAPLSSVLGLVEFLKSAEGAELGSKKREEILNNIQATLEDLFRLINQILKLSSLQTGKISVQKKIVAIRALVDQQISNIAHLAEKKGVRILNNVPDSMTAVADPALLGEVIHNLLANAVKFTGQGDSITVFQNEGAIAEIAVKDTGAGIAPEAIPGIFKHETRPLSSGAGGDRGLGLGLPYSQDIISAHGGALKVESKPGHGSVFSVVLPNFRKLALVADGDDAHRRDMREMIRSVEGVETAEAEDGHAALETMSRIIPDLLICGANLPVVNGFSLLEKVKSNPRLKHIPVIISAPMAYSSTLGPHADQNMKRAAISLGAAEFVTQPVNPEEFTALIQRYVGQTL